jgi:hypothetical protein
MSAPALARGFPKLEKGRRIFCSGADDDDEHHQSEGIISHHQIKFLHMVETFTTRPCILCRQHNIQN